MKKSFYIVVIGCGRLGSILASDLSQKGHEVAVIDPEKSAFSRLSEDFSGFSITGDAAEMNVLQAAKLNKAQVMIAVTGKDNLTSRSNICPAWLASFTNRRSFNFNQSTRTLRTISRSLNGKSGVDSATP